MFFFFSLFYVATNYTENCVQKILKFLALNCFPDINVEQSQGALVFSAVSGALTIPAAALYFFLKDPYEKWLFKKNFLSDISIFDSSNIDEVSLAGYQKERFQLEHIFRVFKKEELCFGNVLLYGPPGTGKTESIFQSLRTVNIPFMRITPRHIFNKYYSPQESLDLILKKIKDQKQCVVIFEEVDMLSQKRELPSTDQKVTIAMLLFFDELKKMNTSRTNKIMTVSTTNYKELLDPAFLRPGRTDKILYFDNTNHQNKREIIDLYMKKYEVNLSDEEIALLINKESISPAEIENALKEKFFLKKAFTLFHNLYSSSGV